MATHFDVDVVRKTSAHPQYGRGSRFGFRVNGVEGGVMRLVRGRTYTLSIDETTRPFYFTRSTLGTAADWSRRKGVDFFGPTSYVQKEPFTVPQNAPSQFYYQCRVHPRMGGRVEVTNAQAASLSAATISSTSHTTMETTDATAQCEFCDAATAMSKGEHMGSSALVCASDACRGRFIEVAEEAASAVRGYTPIDAGDVATTPTGTYSARGTLSGAEVGNIVQSALTASAEQTSGLQRQRRFRGSAEVAVTVWAYVGVASTLGRSKHTAFKRSDSVIGVSTQYYRMSDQAALTAFALSTASTPMTTLEAGKRSQPGDAYYGLGTVRKTNEPLPPLEADALLAPGGVPLYKDGRLVGAVGVAGDSGTVNHAVATAAAKGYEL
jgi:uncharacterized protein GlcG (DUF336 family)